MSNIQIFNNPEFGEIRTIEQNGEPWFVLKDVCEAFGEQNYRRVSARLDEEEKGVSQIATPGGMQNMTVVSEAGLYSTLFAMQPEKARGVDESYIAKRQEQLKRFRKWVTSEVLPSIRKNGGYIAGQEQLTPQELMAKALLVANKTLADREARISELTVQNNIMAPKAEYFDELVDRNMLTSFRDTAKELGVKPKTFVNWLLEKKFIYRNQKGKLMPREDKNNGLFEVKEAKNDKTQWSGVQTLITPKGRETFRLLYL
jgi:prophage antirepressor-like protein